MSSKSLSSFITQGLPTNNIGKVNPVIIEKTIIEQNMRSVEEEVALSKAIISEVQAEKVISPVSKISVKKMSQEEKEQDLISENKQTYTMSLDPKLIDKLEDIAFEIKKFKRKNRSSDEQERVGVSTIAQALLEFALENIPTEKLSEVYNASEIRKVASQHLKVRH